MEMDNNVLDKEDVCYDTTEAAFSDDEEEVHSKGEERLSMSQWNSFNR